MRALSDTLEAMKSNEDSPREPRHGLTTTDGQSPTQRQNPLTQNQIMEIVSQTLQEPFTITLATVTKYGRKCIDGVWHEYEPIGEEQEIHLSVKYKQNLNQMMLNEALAISQPTAILQHLTHLAIHKRFGTNDADRAILLADYVKSLSVYPEFVVHAVCQNYWTNDSRPFIPFIDEMKYACESVKQSLVNQKTKLQIETPRPQKEKYAPHVNPTEEEKTRVAAMLDAFLSPKAI